MSSANSTLMIQIRSVTDAGNVKYKTRTATPEEIKACHPTCNSCEAFDGVCYNEESACFTYEMNPESDYCNHHEPKE